MAIWDTVQSWKRINTGKERYSTIFHVKVLKNVDFGTIYTE